MQRLMLIVAVLSLFATGTAQAAPACPAANTVAARSSGTAPLFVFFDACATGSNNFTCNLDSTLTGTNQSFHDLYYQWNFNDPNAGNWVPDGRPKNTASGPEAAHVFETPGTYQPTLTITNMAGQSCSVTVSPITVAAANTTWSGPKTMCIAASSTPTPGSAGCPVGALVLQQSVFESAMSTALAQGATQILFKGGDSFSATSGYTLSTPGPGYIGSYGTGKANITTSGSGIILTHSANDWRIASLSITGSGTAYQTTNYGISNQSTNVELDQLLVLRVDFHKTSDTNGFADSILIDYSNATGGHPQLGIVENTCDQPGDGIYCIYAGFRQGGILGGTYSDLNATSRSFAKNWRLGCIEKGVFEHNHIAGGLYGNITFIPACNDIGNGTASSPHESVMGVISDNYLNPTQADSSLNIEPTNWDGSGGAGVEQDLDFLVERNQIVMGSAAHHDHGGIFISATRVTARNNLGDLTYSGGYVDAGLVVVASCSNGCSGFNTQPAASGINVYNNSCFIGSANITNSQDCVGVYSQWADVNNLTFRNNLMWGPSIVPGTAMVDCAGVSTCTQDHNLLASSNPFVSSSPVVASDYKLASASAPIGVGAPIGEPPGVPVTVDFGSTPRPNPPSLGAWDVGGTVATLGAPGQPVLLP